MRKLRTVLIALIVLVGTLWAIVRIAYPTYVYRYRLVVEVEVDGNVKTGANVIEVRNLTQPRFGMAGPISLEASGDAIYFDLGKNRHVIATLAFGAKGSIADRLELLVPKLSNMTLEGEDLKRLPSLRGQYELTDEDIPTLVTFADLNDPKTARIVRLEDLPKVFGED